MLRVSSIRNVPFSSSRLPYTIVQSDSLGACAFRILVLISNYLPVRVTVRVKHERFLGEDCTTDAENT